MMRQGLLKQGTTFWTQVPGTPFTVVPGNSQVQERLPGMREWAPRDTVADIAQQMDAGRPVADIAQDARRRGLLQAAGAGGGLGGIIGALGGRLMGGEAATKPFRDILSQGLNLKNLIGLRNLPGVMKWLPAAGAGAGLLAGGINWQQGARQRQEQAESIGQGLLAENVLQRNALREAIKNDSPYTQSILQGVPATPATASPPFVMTPGSAGM